MPPCKVVSVAAEEMFEGHARFGNVATLSESGNLGQLHNVLLVEACIYQP
jgi:hypothetical protein